MASGSEFRRIVDTIGEKNVNDEVLDDTMPLESFTRKKALMHLSHLEFFIVFCVDDEVVEDAMSLELFMRKETLITSRILHSVLVQFEKIILELLNLIKKKLKNFN